eukprot:NODE_30574_length_415_cov_0.979167.p3 GENE.NODE_30574_length_415_cov_0.979167~~NODE_30574_length_415_cov_0.979167.p3  ORF type:complete len:52 (-),score=5.19 NODE_30574_length_415_cov_0.979167:97-252(-)
MDNSFFFFFFFFFSSVATHVAATPRMLQTPALRNGCSHQKPLTERLRQTCG